jgi:hypothetical protein
VARVTIFAALAVALLAGASARAADPCPVAKLAGGSFARYGVARGLGPGPAYPIGFRDVLEFPYPPDPSTGFGDVWGAAKVLWFVASRYRGPVLIRGRKLDADVEVRFDASGHRPTAMPPDELRIPAGWRRVSVPGVPLVGQRYMPSLTRLRESGCYAYQVDGTTFSRVIVFRALAVSE